MKKNCSFCNEESRLHQNIFRSDDGKISHQRCIHQRLTILSQHGVSNSIIQRVTESYQIEARPKPKVIKNDKPLVEDLEALVPIQNFSQRVEDFCLMHLHFRGQIHSFQTQGLIQISKLRFQILQGFQMRLYGRYITS